jgi:hypothetical protein
MPCLYTGHALPLLNGFQETPTSGVLKVFGVKRIIPIFEMPAVHDFSVNQPRKPPGKVSYRPFSQSTD